MDALGAFVASAAARIVDKLLDEGLVAGNVGATEPVSARTGVQTAAAPALSAAATPAEGQGGKASAQAALSPTARVIDALLRVTDGTTEALSGEQPLWPTAPASAAPEASLASSLAMSLAHTLDTSGLFYESHLAQFALGARSAALLEQEPQAHIDQRQDSGTGAAATAAARADGATVQMPVHPAAMPIVRQQLDFLAHDQRFEWQGEAWPGTPMRWSVQRDAQDDAASGAPVERIWRTRLSLSLPSIGPIEIDLSLAGHRLAAGIRASETGAAKLGAASETLRRFVAQSGLELTALSIGAQGAAGPAMPDDAMPAVAGKASAGAAVWADAAAGAAIAPRSGFPGAV
jgi:hypothetical protein